MIKLNNQRKPASGGPSLAVVYEWDAEAADEANRHRLRDEDMPRLKTLIKGKRAALGPQGIRAHTI